MLALGCLRNIYSPIIKVSRLLLLAGADPNYVTDERDQCPILGLHCHHGHVDMVSLLLEYGADPNLTNDRGETPLLLAVTSGREIQILYAYLKKFKFLHPYKIFANIWEHIVKFPHQVSQKTLLSEVTSFSLRSIFLGTPCIKLSNYYEVYWQVLF